MCNFTRINGKTFLDPPAPGDEVVAFVFSNVTRAPVPPDNWGRQQVLTGFFLAEAFRHEGKVVVTFYRIHHLAPVTKIEIGQYEPGIWKGPTVDFTRRQIDDMGKAAIRNFCSATTSVA